MVRLNQLIINQLCGKLFKYFFITCVNFLGSGVKEKAAGTCAWTYICCFNMYTR